MERTRKNKTSTCLCEEIGCDGNNCSIKAFLQAYKKQEMENVAQMLTRLGFISTHNLFPVWDHKYNGIKNKLHKYITSNTKKEKEKGEEKKMRRSSKQKIINGKDYCQITSKQNPKVWKEIKQFLQCPDTSWSVIYVSKDLAMKLKREMLSGKFGEVLGVYERDHVEKLFGMDEEDPRKFVSFSELLVSAKKFYSEFPAWKKIHAKINNGVPIAGHLLPNDSFLEKWINDILVTLHQRIPEAKCDETGSGAKRKTEDISDHPAHSIRISPKLAESFFAAFAGLAYTIAPDTIPGYTISASPDPNAPKRSERLDDLLFHWQNSSLLSVTGDDAPKILKSARNGSYCVRISHHFLWALGTVGISRLLNEERLASNLGPIIICFTNDAGTYNEQLITTQIMTLTTISRQIRSTPGIKCCYKCGKFCVGGSPDPSAPFPSNFGNNSYCNNASFIGDLLAPQGSDCEINTLTNSFVSWNVDPSKSKKPKMEEERMNLEEDSKSSMVPIYCMDEQEISEMVVVSSVELKVLKSPDKTMEGATINIKYFQDKTYSVEYGNRTYKCLVPFIGKSNAVESKIILINDPKITSTFFLKYVSTISVWCCGVIEADTSFEVTANDEIRVDPEIGNTKLFVVSFNKAVMEQQERRNSRAAESVAKDLEGQVIELDFGEDFTVPNIPEFNFPNPSWLGVKPQHTRSPPRSPPRSPVLSPRMGLSLSGSGGSSINPSLLTLSGSGGPSLLNLSGSSGSNGNNNNNPLNSGLLNLSGSGGSNGFFSFNN